MEIYLRSTMNSGMEDREKKWEDGLCIYLVTAPNVNQIALFFPVWLSIFL